MTSTVSATRRRDALSLLMPGVAGTTLPDWLGALLREGLGGVCLFGHNVESPEQVAELTAAIYELNPQAIVAIDEEGGDVSRLHQHAGSPFPGNAVLGRLDDIEITRAVAHGVGAELAGVGVYLTLAPDADVNSNPDNPVIGVRSFGADPDAVAAHTAAWIEGVQAAGVGACAKHFPGHGDTSSDSHVAEPVVTADAATLAAREFVPFRAAIDAGTKTIMTSHIRVPAFDPDAVATFSSTILGDVLRKDLGFEGVVVTDALDMIGASGERGIPAAAVAAVAAGSDLLCLGSNNPESEINAVADALVNAVDIGELSPGRLADAVGRCSALAQWLADQRRSGNPQQVEGPQRPALSPGQVAASFTLSDHAKQVLDTSRRPVQWVMIEPTSNFAIGVTPFGPFFDGGAKPSMIVPIENRRLADDYVADPDGLTVIVGREIHRDEGALDAATSIAGRTNAVIVDMGFAHCDQVDIATFGASRLVGQALLDLVEAHE